MVNGQKPGAALGPAPTSVQGASTTPVAGTSGNVVQPPSVPASQQPLPGPSRDLGDATALASITVSSRIPEFWTDMPRLWFLQFEAAVENQRLGDTAKQNLVVTKLSKHAIKQVSDLLLSPPQSERYETLKERLLKIYEESDTRQTQKLLGEMELGTQKPSQLLRNMRDLARGKILDQTLIIMWNGHLPPAVQAVLAASEVTDMETLATIADKVMEATRPLEVTEIAASKQRPKESSSSDLTAKLNRLSVEVAELRRARRPQRSTTPGRAGRQPSRSRERNASRSGRKPGWLCFYHFRYGEKAAKCVKPCYWEDQKEKEN
ncbi:uncharacterized protein LOC134648205 [Cydia amplana]|uniref:uncharacterized protein LOC134648205 n=1 Tax=Cydia amplana TaxID=1869771 RepID=UPI002FE5B32A